MKKSKACLGIMAIIVGVHVSSLEQVFAAMTQTSLTRKGEAVTSEIQRALEQLKKTEILESAYVGFVGSLSENLVALRVLIQSENPKALLLELHKDGGSVGQLYAIIGLQLINETDLATSLIQSLKQSSAITVQTMAGCIISSENLGDVLTRIEKGEYRDEFRD